MEGECVCHVVRLDVVVIPLVNVRRNLEHIVLDLARGGAGSAGH